MKHRLILHFTWVTLFCLFSTQILWGVTHLKLTLKDMFHNPVNLNTVSKEDIKIRLKVLSFSDTKINRILLYIFVIKKQKINDFDEFVRDRILNQRELEILSRFTILKEEARFQLFEQDMDNDYHSFDDRIFDTDFRINLNRFDKATLLSLTFMTEQSVRAILRYRRTNGQFNSIYQLLLIPDLDPAIFLRLKPYLSSLKYDKKKTKSSLEIRYRNGTEQINPDQDNKYYFYTRLNLSLDDGIDFKLSGIKSEDQIPNYPGSLLSSKINDYNYYRQYSLALYIEKKDLPVPFIALGDYSLRFGQHLVFGDTFPALIDRIDKHPIKKQDYGIRRFQNPNRTGALRGMAFNVPMGQFKLTPFTFMNSYELNKTRFLQNGANISYERLVTDISAISLDKSESERLIESGGGLNLVFSKKDRIRIGATFAYIKLSENLNPQIREPDDNHLFRGNDLYLSSTYFDWWITKYLNLFSEVAVSSHKDPTKQKDTVTDLGAVVGGILDLQLLKYSVMTRYLGPDFHSPHSGRVIKKRRNEKGLIQGLYIPVNKTLSFRTYFDYFKDLDELPLSKDLNNKLSYRLSSNLVLSYIFGYSENWSVTEYLTRTKNQGNLEYYATSYLAFRLRYENILSSRNSETANYRGNLFYTQLKSLILKTFIATFRVTFYNVEDYDAAVYTVENLLPYWFNGVKSYNDKGIHYDLIIMSKVSDLQFGLKYSRDDRQEKSGNKVIEILYLQSIYSW